MHADSLNSVDLFSDCYEILRATKLILLPNIQAIQYINVLVHMNKY